MAAAPTPIDGNEYGLWAVLIAGFGIILQLIMNAGSAAWTLRASKSATDDKIAENDKDVREQLTELERHVNSEIDGVRRDTGESDQAIRTKITQIELWNRDNFVSKETYRDMQDSLKDLRKHVDTRFDRLEEKLEDRRN